MVTVSLISSGTALALVCLCGTVRADCCTTGVILLSRFRCRVACELSLTTAYGVSVVEFVPVETLQCRLIDDAKIIPGSGSVSSKDGLKQYLGLLVEVAQVLRQQMTPDEMKNARPPEERGNLEQIRFHFNRAVNRDREPACRGNRRGVALRKFQIHLWNYLLTRLVNLLMRPSPEIGPPTAQLSDFLFEEASS